MMQSKKSKEILFYTILPLFVIIVLSVKSVLNNKEQYDEFSKLNKIVHYNFYISKIFHELQKERGMSLVYLSSKGKKFSSSLFSQIKKTNEKISDFKIQISLKKSNKNVYLNIQKKLTSLIIIRKSIKNFEISNKKALSLYSKIIKNLFSIINRVDKPLINKKVNKYIYSYYTFLLAKEQVGLERALITQILEEKKLGSIKYADIIALQTLEKLYLELSFKNANYTIHKNFEVELKNSIKNTNKMIEKIIYNINEKNLLKLDSQVWFTKISEQINLLQKFEYMYTNILKKEMLLAKNKIIFDVILNLVLNLFVIIFFIFLTKKRINNLNGYFRNAIKKIKKNNENNNKNYENFTYSLLNIIEQRDSYTANHSKRVSIYCKLIAKAMKFTNKDIEKLSTAALLHDIGKIQTPDSILFKPSSLNLLEYDLIKNHSLVGYKILNEINLYQDVAKIVRNHHEYYDGSGYPDGLKKDEIHPLSRILIIADAFDSMTTSRKYKKNLSKYEALLELYKFKGIQFHPEEVDIAINALKDIDILHNEEKELNKIEEERFSYFYKDQLTNCFNRASYELNIIENKTVINYFFKTSINIKNLSMYNEHYSWNKGDEVLKNLAQYLLLSFPKDKIFRIKGNCFIILHNSIKENTLLLLKKELTSFLDLEIISLELLSEKIS